MRRVNINLPEHVIVEARRSVADTPGVPYADAIRRWIRKGMEAEREGLVSEPRAPYGDR